MCILSHVRNKNLNFGNGIGELLVFRGQISECSGWRQAVPQKPFWSAPLRPEPGDRRGSRSTWGCGAAVSGPRTRWVTP